MKTGRRTNKFSCFQLNNMIKSTKDISQIPNEIEYNKITIAITIIISLLAYINWEQACGIITWVSFIIMLTLITISSIMGCVNPIIAGGFILVGLLPLLATIIATPVMFTHDFWNTLTINFSEERIGDAKFFFILFMLKEYFIEHPELGTIWTSLIFLGLLWAHPKGDEKYKAYNPQYIADYIKEESSDFIKFILKLIIVIIAAYLQNATITTIIVWYMFYILAKTNLKRIPVYNRKRLKPYLALYIIITFSYTLFGTDKSPLDALIGIITMNP